MGSKVTTTAEYLEELAPERRALVGTLRQVVLANLPKGYSGVASACDRVPMKASLSYGTAV